MGPNDHLTGTHTVVGQHQSTLFNNSEKISKVAQGITPAWSSTQARSTVEKDTEEQLFCDFWVDVAILCHFQGKGQQPKVTDARRYYQGVSSNGSVAIYLMFDPLSTPIFCTIVAVVGGGIL